MDKDTHEITSIDAYIATFPEEIQRKLQKLREVIQAAAPEATEKISYQMPTFYLNGNLVHFAAFQASYWLLSHSQRNRAFSERALIL